MQHFMRQRKNLKLRQKTGDYDTLSGLLVNKLGKIPTKKDIGTVIEIENVSYKIEKVKDKHISQVKACKINEIDKE